MEKILVWLNRRKYDDGVCFICALCFPKHFLVSDERGQQRSVSRYCRSPHQLLKHPETETEERRREVCSQNESEKRITPLWLFGYLLSQLYGFVIELKAIIFCTSLENISDSFRCQSLKLLMSS